MTFAQAAAFLAKAADDHLESGVQTRFFVLCKKKDSEFAAFADSLSFDRKENLISAADKRLIAGRFNPEE